MHNLILLQRFCAILLLMSALVVGCDSGERKLQAPQLPGDEVRDVEAATVQMPVRAGADTTILSNQLMSSLAPDLSVELVLRSLPEAEVSRREPHPNRHIEGQIDTLVTVKSDSTIFKFYSLATKDLLESATLRKGGVAIGSGLEVGMTTDEVARRVPAFQQLSEMPQSIIIRAEQAPTTLRLRFKDNRLAYIQYDGYVD